MRVDQPKRNGRTASGQFAKGNAGGPGNPHAKRVADLRAALLEAVTPEDIRTVATALVARAKAGEVPAIRELLDRLLGKVTANATPEDEKQIVLNVITNVPERD
jgi:hypothetical protein